MAKRKPKGWRFESTRHSLASKGIKTGQKIQNSRPTSKPRGKIKGWELDAEGLDYQWWNKNTGDYIFLRENEGGWTVYQGTKMSNGEIFESQLFPKGNRAYYSFEKGYKDTVDFMRKNPRDKKSLETKNKNYIKRLKNRYDRLDSKYPNFSSNELEEFQDIEKEFVRLNVVYPNNQ